MAHRQKLLFIATAETGHHSSVEVVDKCPFRKGKDKRECVFNHKECMYGISEVYVPNHCPITKNGVQIRVQVDVP